MSMITVSASRALTTAVKTFLPPWRKRMSSAKDHDQKKNAPRLLVLDVSRLWSARAVTCTGCRRCVGNVRSEARAAGAVAAVEVRAGQRTVRRCADGYYGHQ